MFHQLITQLSNDTLYVSLPAFSVELILCVTIILLLLSRLFPLAEKIDAAYIAFVGVLTALIFLSPLQPWDVSSALQSGNTVVAEGEATQSVKSSELSQVQLADLPRVEIFTGMLVYDGFTVLLKTILLIFLLLFIVFCKITGITTVDENTDFMTLLLGATLGMCIMASANHMLTIFLGVEMASVPSYAMVAFVRRNKSSSEAALKYAIYGAGTAGVMLYGISLLCGILNSAHLPTMAIKLAEMFTAGASSSEITVLTIGALMLAVGLAFKLSAVPFHFWCPDVFEGTTAEVNAFLSIASKAAALALLIRVAIGFSYLPATEVVLDSPPEEENAKVVEGDKVHFTAAVLAEDVKSEPAEKEDGDNPPVENKVEPVGDKANATKAATVSRASLDSVRYFIAYLVGFIAIITCTFGNLTAYGQTNIKRLLAYSTIAHAGYMMMAVPGVILLSADYPELAQTAVAGLALYIVIYVFMNLGAFAIVALVRNTCGSEEITDYSGMIGRSKVIAISFTLILVSLVGLPPLAGFFGKFVIFASLAQGYIETANGLLLWLLIFGGLNTAISLYYYLKIVKVMIIDQEQDDTANMQRSLGILENSYLILVSLPIVLLVINWDFLNVWIKNAVSQLLT